MTRWREISKGRTGHEYAARFDQLAASGADVHGEANLVTALAATGSRVLDAGCGTGRVALRLRELDYECVGVDLDPSMLEVARGRGPEIPWYEADLAALRLPDEAAFDLIVAAGNIMPLLAEGTGPAVAANLAALLVPGGVLVAGFGLDAAHLPIPEPTVDLPGYDGWCTAAGLVLERRLASWDGAPYEGGGYAVSIHRINPRRNGLE
ncbi:MAG TPA: class I SAM-dependent methyltransferase [Frankiaceae bacterium]|jgi:SAM-dependent methyltransferase|nr:class I SAM-dependent methyltransferase [Frankiaceae bacterium]